MMEKIFTNVVNVGVVGLIFGTLACTKMKEQELQKLMSEKKSPSTEELISQANTNPNFETLTAAGFSLSQAKKPEAAIVYFEQALTKAPENSVALNNLCAENNNLGHYDKAINFCEKAISVAKDFLLAKNNLKFAQEKKAAQQTVISGLKSKIESEKGSTKQAAFIDLGFEYYKMGQFEEAITTWKKVSKSNEALHVRTLNNLGSAYIQLKKFDLAKSSLDEAMKLDPKNQLVKNNMAWLQSETNAVAK